LLLHSLVANYNLNLYHLLTVGRSAANQQQILVFRLLVVCVKAPLSPLAPRSSHCGRIHFHQPRAYDKNQAIL